MDCYSNSLLKEGALGEEHQGMVEEHREGEHMMTIREDSLGRKDRHLAYRNPLDLVDPGKRAVATNKRNSRASVHLGIPFVLDLGEEAMSMTVHNPIASDGDNPDPAKEGRKEMVHRGKMVHQGSPVGSHCVCEEGLVLADAAHNTQQLRPIAAPEPQHAAREVDPPGARNPVRPVQARRLPSQSPYSNLRRNSSLPAPGVRRVCCSHNLEFGVAHLSPRCKLRSLQPTIVHPHLPGGRSCGFALALCSAGVIFRVGYVRDSGPSCAHSATSPVAPTSWNCGSLGEN